MLNSPTLHLGQVIHRRISPFNFFRYPIFYLRIPMRSRRVNPKVLEQCGIADNRFSWLSFYDRDHGSKAPDSLAWAEELLKNEGHSVDGEIWLHTFPRILGYVFNPVSFWFCHQATGELKVIIAEVNNTFGERCSYILQSDQHDFIQFGESILRQKNFHVSPFFPVQGHYIFRFLQQSHSKEPRFVSRIEYHKNNQLALTTSISGVEYPITRGLKYRSLLKFPFLTFSVILKIHWQAIKLLIKGAIFHQKPQTPSQQYFTK